MSVLLLLACAGMIAGAFFLLRIAPLEFTDGLFGFLTRPNMSVRAEINEATQRKKAGFLRREIIEVQEILKLTGRGGRFSMICAASLLLFAVGASLAILLGNLFLIPVLAAGLMFLPFWAIRLTAIHYQKSVAAELETALSIITTSYLRNEDILTAVEESVQYLNPPVRNVFAGFLTQVKLIDPDVQTALQALKPKIQNEVFQEWTDAISACQYDRSLKTTLTPIVAKLSDMRIVNADLEYLVSEPRKEFIIMALLVVGNVPIMYFLNKGWYHTLMYTPVGQIILAVCTAAIFISAAWVIKLTKPIEYRR
ncbi:type II secretion system F family protein [Desulfitobacterium hafniense]|uniref:type II secretion system F family protein n=1 Tax=Desulfitobacterium hafniense TaxID=49338 RepID=UPI0002FAE280|nr:membrane protein [Desulfitobacterium hafniense]